MRVQASWVAAGIGAVALGLGAAWLVAQPPSNLGQYDRLAGEIGCQCGTCPLRPIATCGCGFADGMLDELRALVDEGHGDDEIFTTFVARYNESIRISPRSDGVALTAWAAPLLLLTVGAVVVAGVLARWARVPDAPDETMDPSAGTPASGENDSDDQRLRAAVDRELEELNE